MTDEDENDAAEEDPPADGDEAPDDEAEEDDPGEEQGEFTELAQVMTVTAKKLASMTQGRKFKHAPKKSIEQRKKETTCAACGVKGHWAGDAECGASNGSSFSKDQSKGNGEVSQRLQQDEHQCGDVQKGVHSATLHRLRSRG